MDPLINHLPLVSISSSLKCSLKKVLTCDTSTGQGSTFVPIMSSERVLNKGSSNSNLLFPNVPFFSSTERRLKLRNNLLRC